MQNSAIEWTNHTFNPWWGCVKVSPGCQHCYAETLAHRYNHNVWGPAKTTGRRMMSAAYWQQPIKWDDAARRAGQRARIYVNGKQINIGMYDTPDVAADAYNNKARELHGAFAKQGG